MVSVLLVVAVLLRLIYILSCRLYSIRCILVYMERTRGKARKFFNHEETKFLHIRLDTRLTAVLEEIVRNDEDGRNLSWLVEDLLRDGVTRHYTAAGREVPDLTPIKRHKHTPKLDCSCGRGPFKGPAGLHTHQSLTRCGGHELPADDEA
jgi:hypothetical protein